MPGRLKLILLFCCGISACDEQRQSADTLQPSPENAMSEFFSNPGAEDTLMDPLIVAGPAVYPLVIDAIQDPDMPRRRYAIGFLGNEEVSDALPILLAILNSESELPYFRGDALVAIYKIDRGRAKELALQFRDREDALGYYALDVIADAEYLNERRSLAKARLRWHE